MSFFVPGVAPPKSKYTFADLRLDGSDDDDEYDDMGGFAAGGDGDDNDEDPWMCSSAADDIKCEVVDKTNTTEQQSLAAVTYNFQDWLEIIEDHYFNERDDLVRRTIQSVLEDTPRDPYGFILHVMHRAFFDLYSKRLPITFIALDEIDVWLQLKELNGQPVCEPNSNHKRLATEFLCRSGYDYLDKMSKVFQLDKKENSFLAEYVNLEDLRNRKLKQTVIIIYTLKLQRCFDIEEILTPLIANDQLQTLEIYIADDGFLQNGYLKLLDKFCSMKSKDIEDLVREKGLKMKDSSKMQHKTLVKLADKALKRYHLDPDDFPNVFASKNISSLYYLIRMRLQEEGKDGAQVKQQKWDQLIETAVEGKVWLQKKLLQRLVELNHTDIALFWVNQLSMSSDDIPTVLADEYDDSNGVAASTNFRSPYYDEEIADSEDLYSVDLATTTSTIDEEDGESPQQSEDWDEELENTPGPSFSIRTGFMYGDEAQEDYYQLKIPTERIIMVDTVEMLDKMIRVLFKTGNVIGFDAEWKSIMCRAGENQIASILQLALSDQIFILDVKTLYVTHGAEEKLKEFFFNFFTSKNVVKVGYGISSDLKIFMGMFGYAKEFIRNANCLVDLCELAQKIIPNHLVGPHLFEPRKVALAGKGLSLLVKRTLGKCLDKTFQVSDWERRPLSDCQMKYAALDAFCVVEVYNVLCGFVKKYNLKVNLTGNVRMKWIKKDANSGKRKDKYENRENKEKAPAPDNKPLFKGAPRPSTSLKVVCDTMLQGLGRQLRNCGVDTLILDNTDDHSTTLQISRRDDRVILTRGKPYFMLRGHVREGMCMWVPDGSLKEQVKMVFTRYNLVIRSQDVMTRCTICNSNVYTEVASDDMRIAFELKHDVGNAEMSENQRSPSGIINLSNFTLEGNGVELQLDFFTTSKFEKACKLNTLFDMFDKVRFFYVCNGCGKVYWEGSHHAAVRTNFADLIDKREKDKNYYGTPG